MTNTQFLQKEIVERKKGCYGPHKIAHMKYLLYIGLALLGLGFSSTTLAKEQKSEEQVDKFSIRFHFLLQPQVNSLFVENGPDTNGFLVRQPVQHAGGKWRLRYDSSLGETGHIEVDLNYVFRVPLWPPLLQESKRVCSYSTNKIPVLPGQNV